MEAVVDLVEGLEKVMNRVMMMMMEWSAHSVDKYFICRYLFMLKNGGI